MVGGGLLTRVGLFVGRQRDRERERRIRILPLARDRYHRQTTRQTNNIASPREFHLHVPVIWKSSSYSVLQAAFTNIFAVAAKQDSFSFYFYTVKEESLFSLKG